MAPVIDSLPLGDGGETAALLRLAELEQVRHLTARVETPSMYDSTVRQAYRSAPHSPQLFGPLSSRLSSLHTLRSNHAGANKGALSCLTTLAVLPSPVGSPMTTTSEVSEESHGTDGTVCEDANVVLVTEAEQCEMKAESQAVRGNTVRPSYNHDMNRTGCRCISSSTIFPPSTPASRTQGPPARGTKAVPALRHASLAVHCDGESHFFEDHHRGVVLHYKLFGHSAAPQKILFIMGLATQGIAWSYQTEYFRHFSDYQVCIFDNRGVGLSSKPLDRYTTSVMAEDAACLLDHLKWNAYRSIHVVGVSMGGMIAQELSLLVPDRILSLALLCTYSGGITWRTLPALSGATKFISTAMGFLAGERAHKESIARFLFTEKSIRNDGDRLRDYLSASVRDGGISALGSILQYPAVVTHHLSTKQLRQVRFCSFKKIVVTGAEDDIVCPRNSHWLASHLGCDLVLVEGTGHGVTAEKPDVLNPLLHKHFVDSVDHFRRTHALVHHHHL